MLKTGSGSGPASPLPHGEDEDGGEDEDCAEAFAIVDKMALVECGQFKKESTTQKYLPKAKYFWTSYTFKDDADVSKVGTFEYNNFPTHSTKTGGSYDLAIPVRCVK